MIYSRWTSVVVQYLPYTKLAYAEKEVRNSPHATGIFCSKRSPFFPSEVLGKTRPVHEISLNLAQDSRILHT
jgi:hypothetical protein